MCYPPVTQGGQQIRARQQLRPRGKMQFRSAGEGRDLHAGIEAGIGELQHPVARSRGEERGLRPGQVGGAAMCDLHPFRLPVDDVKIT